jgi:hypothetical protein
LDRSGSSGATWTSESDSWASAILVNELHACILKGSSKHTQGSSARVMAASLKLANGHYSHTGAFGQFTLTPVQQSSSRAALFWREHDDHMPPLR